MRYRYDAAGMRVQATRSSDGRVTTWGYNGSTVAAMWRETAGEPRVLVSTFVTAPSGDPLQSTADGETVYSMLDGLGSVTGTLDAAGGVASSSAYSVFGQPAGTGPVGLGDVYGYTGHAWDGDAGMHYARARWYDAGVGRFASEDPVDAMNLYPYVGNQPMDYVDPTGEIAAAQYSLISNRIQIAIAIGHMFMGDVEKWALDRGVPQGAICGANHVQTFALLYMGNCRVLHGCHQHDDSGKSAPHVHVDDDVGAALDQQPIEVPGCRRLRRSADLGEGRCSNRRTSRLPSGSLVSSRLESSSLSAR